jgi:hypothetical protein
MCLKTLAGVDRCREKKQKLIYFSCFNATMVFLFLLFLTVLISSHCFNFSLMLIMDGVPAALTQ